jgi:hypothetical protein
VPEKPARAWLTGGYLIALAAVAVVLWAAVILGHQEKTRTALVAAAAAVTSGLFSVTANLLQSSRQHKSMQAAERSRRLGDVAESLAAYQQDVKQFQKALRRFSEAAGTSTAEQQAATDDYLEARVTMLTSRKALLGLIARGRVAADASLDAQLGQLTEFVQREVNEVDISADLSRLATDLAAS